VRWQRRVKRCEPVIALRMTAESGPRMTNDVRCEWSRTFRYRS
jgi:hypothetical protein